MNEDTETLAELMLHTDQFCSRVSAIVKDAGSFSDEKELHAKLGQCRTQLAYLQTVFDNDELSIENPSVRADFRHLVIALMWIAFHARKLIDFRAFRMLVRIESGFTYLLITK